MPIRMAIYLRLVKGLPKNFPLISNFLARVSQVLMTSLLKSSTVPRVLPYTLWEYSSSRNSSSWLERLDFRQTVSNKDRRVYSFSFYIVIDYINALANASSKCTWATCQMNKRANAIFDADKLMQSSIARYERETDDAFVFYYRNIQIYVLCIKNFSLFKKINFITKSIFN